MLRNRKHEFVQHEVDATESINLFELKRQQKAVVECKFKFVREMLRLHLLIKCKEETSESTWKKCLTIENAVFVVGKFSYKSHIICGLLYSL